MSTLKHAKIARVATVPIFFAAHLKEQLRQITGAGAHVTLICSRGKEINELPIGENLKFVEVEIRRRISPWADLKALAKLFTLFRRGEYSATHSSTPKAGLLCAIAAFFARVPVRIHTFTGQPWVTLGNPWAAILKSCDQLTAALSTHCYADSNSQRDFLIKCGIVRPDKIYVVANGSIAGVDTMRFNQERFIPQSIAEFKSELGIPHNAFIFLFLGRICKDKGIEELLAALDLIAEKPTNAHLLLVGPIETSAADSAPMSSDTLNAHPRVTQVGYSDSPEQFIAMADCLCLPSYREGFGSVVIEAAAMGVPSIGTDIYGLKDAIVDGETGILVPAHDEQQLALAMQKLCNNREIATQMGAAARTRARKLFSSETVNAAVVAEYERLIS